MPIFILIHRISSKCHIICFFIDSISFLLSFLSLTLLLRKNYIEEDSLVYVSIPEKGGESIIIGKDGDVLYADSSVGYLHNRQAEKFKMVH